MSKFSLLVFIILSSFVTYAQKLSVSKPAIETYAYDSTYIEPFNSQLALRFVVPRRLEQFSLKNSITGKKYIYSSNEHIGVGLGFTYKSLAVDLTINPDFTQRDIAKYGNTNEFNVKGSAYLKRTLLDGYLRSYRGYYVSNPTKNFSNWSSELPYPQRQDIRTLGWGFNYTVPFNWKKYTPKVTFILDGKLKKSAGSFMSISTAYFYHLRADSSIVDDSFEAEAKIYKANLALLSELFGYAYTFVYKDFYVTLSAFPGLTLPVGAVYSEAGGANPKFTANFKFMTRSGLGYNSPKWYAGIYFILDTNDIKLPSSLLLGNSLGEFRFFVGYRIKPPKVVDKVIDRL